MKKTSLIDLFATIKTTRVAFVSIAIFTALSISIILGFTWTINSLETTISCYESDSDSNLHDLDVIFPYGFSDEDVAAIEALEEVGCAEGRWRCYDFYTLDESRYQVMLVQITDEIDKLQLKEGRLPDKSGEVALDYDFATNHDLKVGDTISFEADSADGDISISKIMSFDPETDDVDEYFGEDDDSTEPSDNQKYLNTDSYLVTALVVSPEYACSVSMSYGVAATNQVSVDTACYLDESSFDPEAFLGYTDIIISSKNGDEFQDDDYDEYISTLRENVTEIVEPVAYSKKTAVIAQVEAVSDAINDKLGAADEEIDEASLEIDENQEQIDEGRKQIDDAQYQLEKASEQLKDVEYQLEETGEQLKSAKKQLEDAKVQIDSGEEQLDEGKEEYEAREKEWLEGYNQLEDGKNKLKDAQAEYDYERCQYDGAMRDFNIVKSIFSDGENIIYDIRSGNINIANYEEYISKWELSDKINTLKTMQEKYGNQYGMSFDIDSLAQQIVSRLDDDSDQSAGEKLDSCLDEIESFYENESSSIISQFEQKLKEASDELDTGLEELHAAQEEINHGQAEVDYYRQELDDAARQIAEKEQELSDAKSEYEEGLAEYEKKKAQYDEGLSECEEKLAELESGASELESKELDLSSAQEELNSAREKVLEAIRKFEDEKSIANENIKEMDDAIDSDSSYSILTRNSIAYLYSLQLLNNIIAKLKYSLAGLFAVIGILVCYSAITRIVYLQMPVIGTKKALGFLQKEITGLYLSYSGLACLMGCVVSIIIGFAFERALIIVLSNNFRFGSYYHVYDLPPVLIACSAAFFILLIISFAASYKMLTREATELLAGEIPDIGRHRFYEETKFFKNLSFLGKTIVNNCVSDKRRVFGTIVGITGCMALIVTSLTLLMNVNSSFSKQFTDFYHFNYIIYFDSSEAEDAQDNIEEVLEKYTDKIAVVRREQQLYDGPDGMMNSFYMYVPSDAVTFSNIVEFNTRDYSKDNDPYEGIWINYSYKNYYGDEAEDLLELYSVTGSTTEVPVSGYFDHYITTGEMFTSKDYYEKYFDDEFTTNAVLVYIDHEDTEEILGELNNIEGYVKADDYYKESKYAFTMFQSFSTAVVILYMMLAVAMSFLVLLNLQNQFVDEKKRELTVMLINGFYLKAAKRYIYSDTVILSVVSLILGAGLGSVIGNVSISTFDSDVICFISSVNWGSCIIGAAISAFLTFIMTLTAIRKIDHFVLTDINRY